MKCVDCRKELTKEEEKINKRIAIKLNSRPLNMCSACWDEYCQHAMTGD